LHTICVTKGRVVSAHWEPLRADAKDFFDTPSVIDAMFDGDWARLMAKVRCRSARGMPTWRMSDEPLRGGLWTVCNITHSSLRLSHHAAPAFLRLHSLRLL
jgi:hypothetical protein